MSLLLNLCLVSSKMPKFYPVNFYEFYVYDFNCIVANKEIEVFFNKYYYYHHYYYYYYYHYYYYYFGTSIKTGVILANSEDAGNFKDKIASLN